MSFFKVNEWIHRRHGTMLHKVRVQLLDAITMPCHCDASWSNGMPNVADFMLSNRLLEWELSFSEFTFDPCGCWLKPHRCCSGGWLTFQESCLSATQRGDKMYMKIPKIWKHQTCWWIGEQSPLLYFVVDIYSLKVCFMWSIFTIRELMHINHP